MEYLIEGLDGIIDIAPLCNEAILPPSGGSGPACPEYGCGHGCAWVGNREPGECVNFRAPTPPPCNDLRPL